MKVSFVLLLLLITTISNAQQRAPLALEKLVQACSASHSTSVSVWYDGKNVLDTVFTGDHGLSASHSVLKSIAALAVGRLIMDSKLRGVEMPVHEIFPEWNQGLKKKITIKQLLNHTSGIECTDPGDDYFNATDVVQHALCANIVDTPGSRFEYNSKAFLLLLGIIAKASSMKTDRYIDQMIFKPLGIKQFHWSYDLSGNVTGLSTTAAELVKIGQLVINGGAWSDKEIVSKAWIDQMLTVSQPFAGDCALLWWRIPETTYYIVDDKFIAELKQAGVKQVVIDKFRSLRGSYANVNIPAEKLQAAFGANWQTYLDKELYPYFPRRSRREYSEKTIGYKAEGHLGQYIVIYPGKRIVAARMVREKPAYNAQTDEMLDFEKLVYILDKGK